MNKNSISKMTWLIIISFLLVPICVSVISTIHVINFFSLSNGFGLALTLAIAFEIGALSALAGLVALGKINKNVVWFIFILLTIFQVNGNTYYAYDVLTQKMVIEPNLIKNWAELFGLADEDPIFIKRIIALISGGILPIVSLAFLDLLVDYIRKTFGIEENKLPENIDLKKNTEVNLEDTPSSQIVVESKEEKSVIEEENIDLDEKLDSIISDGKVETHEEENFQKILDEKKKRLDDMRQPNMDMLSVLYDDGKIQSGMELASYNDFINKLEKNRYSQKEINLFLTLCNYLEIFKVSYTQKIALKSYDEAKEILSNYLTLGE
jgi:hypothetical protein